jgi:hypothetical protein
MSGAHLRLNLVDVVLGGTTLVIMTTLIAHASFDSIAARLFGVLGKVLGVIEDPEDSNQPGDQVRLMPLPTAPSGCCLSRSPDASRSTTVHLDLKPAGACRGIWNSNMSRIIGVCGLDERVRHHRQAAQGGPRG